MNIKIDASIASPVRLGCSATDSYPPEFPNLFNCDAVTVQIPDAATALTWSRIMRAAAWFEVAPGQHCNTIAGALELARFGGEASKPAPLCHRCKKAEWDMHGKFHDCVSKAQQRESDRGDSSEPNY